MCILPALIACLGCKISQPAPQASDAPILLMPGEAVPVSETAQAPEPASRPGLRYLFLFIGDGMGANQALCVNEALAQQNKPSLCFTRFPIQGGTVTNNVHGKLTDSAAAATAIATGHKTANGMLGQDAEGNRRITIAETLHAAGYGVGVLTTVSLDNATPAGFYAHTAARTNYREIGIDLFISGFDYFAGGGFHDGADIAALAAEFSYSLAIGDAAADTVPAGFKMVLSSETLADDRGMPLALDADAVRAGQLARNLTRGVERLADDGKGFFIMAEGGRIDLACHYHDPGGLYAETLDFDLAVQAAVAFYEAHPEETLIIVTADHETGGLVLAEGDRAALARQAVSCDRFDKTLAERFRADKTAFETALPEICAAFGLSEPTDEERAYLKTAYGHTLSGKLTKAQALERYGVYSPVASAAAKLVAQRAGLSFSTHGHSSVNVPVYALGRGAELFSGTYENTAIAEKIMDLVAQFGA